MALPNDSIYATLSATQRVWAVGAIRGQTERLEALHTELEKRFERYDRLVYLGNFLGFGDDVGRTIDELLRFRRTLLARPAMIPADIVFLRGAQEEMWRKLLELQFAPNPGEVLTWMLDQGVSATLATYGGRPEEGHGRCREGAMAITRWTVQLRAAVHDRPGHDELLGALKRLAFTQGGELLFVAAGLDPSRPLSEQGDTLWWGSGYFAAIEAPYANFARVVRGHDRGQKGLEMGGVTATLDGGCGFGGNLNAACFTLDGKPADWIQV
jgi:serine/threonine protein phosphatase 1